MNNEEFWKEIFNQYDISMKDDNRSHDGLDDLFILSLEEDEYYPTPEGFEGIYSPCCTAQIILMWNKDTNEYLGICEECNKDLCIFKGQTLILHHLKTIRE